MSFFYYNTLFIANIYSTFYCTIYLYYNTLYYLKLKREQKLPFKIQIHLFQIYYSSVVSTLSTAASITSSLISSAVSITSLSTVSISSFNTSVVSSV